MYHGIVPRRLATEKKLMALSSVALKDPAGRSWPVELRKGADGRMKMKRGWVDFGKANDIAVGDTVIFEFTTMPTVLQVHIFRKEGRAISTKTVVFRADILKRFEAQ